MIFRASSLWPEVMVTLPSVITPCSTLSFGVTIFPSTLPVCRSVTSSDAEMLPMSVPAMVTFRAWMSVLTFPVGPTMSWSSVRMSPWNFPSIMMEPFT